ncbi:hypothetical protein PVOR_00600 [Paenibacillus vortex V453]|uniref:Uncharacterized protein n=1 Tax=Paenibacillus vortex V453 TaxID=715225 RepID=A0A2R9T2F6_9BACL|nr:hypothetical protein PVOR_00600 [Paenibacillus vortex V453]
MSVLKTFVEEKRAYPAARQSKGLSFFCHFIVEWENNSTSGAERKEVIQVNMSGIVFFLAIVVGTLMITY